MISDIRIGQGCDVHRFTEGRPLILCGVKIPYERGLLGHSDADVAVHASLPEERVSIKAKTNEGMGFIGRLEGMEARAAAVLIR